MCQHPLLTTLSSFLKKYALVAVDTATERVVAAAYLVGLRNQVLGKQEVGGRIVIAPAIVGQVVARRLVHVLVPLLGDAHAEDDRLRDATHVLGAGERREPVGLLQEVAVMQVAVDHVVLDVNARSIDLDTRAVVDECIARLRLDVRTCRIGGHARAICRARAL